MKIDKSKFIATFKSEAEGYLTQLNQGIVQLEKNPKDPELLNELFRSAHTLKGAAWMMGFSKIRDIAHKIEDLFGMLKEDRLTFESVTADCVFQALDVIKEALDKTVTGKEQEVEIKAVCKNLVAVACGKKVEVKKHSPEADQPPAEETRSKETYDEPQETSDEYIRVPLSRINQLLNLIGEMVINRVKSSYKMELFKKLSGQARLAEKNLYSLESILKEALGISDELIHHRGSILRASQEMEKAAHLLNSLHDVETLISALRKDMVQLSDEIQNEVFHLGPVIDELQQKMKEIRMLPCSTIFEGFPRLIRDIAREQKKQVEFIMRGEETEIDKKVLEAIKGPLIHLLRNAIDHGVEKEGTITLAAFQEGGKVVVEVSDNGQGIDLEKVKETALQKEVVSQEELANMTDKEILSLVFAEGFSTAPIITDVSGRGVGLDVVRTEMERLKSSVTIWSQKGSGTTVRLEMPLTIAIMQVLLFEVGSIRFALPTANLKESLMTSQSEIATIENRMVIQIREHSVPLVSLGDLLGIGKQAALRQTQDTARDRQQKKEMTVILVSSMNKQVGFIVDRVFGEEEIFIKAISSHLGKVKGVSGATILASGEVIVILDAQDIISQAELAHPSLRPHEKMAAPKKKKRVLLVEDSLTTRELERTILVNNGYVVEIAIDGLDALDKLLTTSVDVIVSDIQMPRMDGFEFCQNVKKNKKFKQIPLIFVTALSKEEEKRKGIKVGAQAYITKSEFDQGNLLETIERLI